jgi:hypothetical protein
MAIARLLYQEKAAKRWQQQTMQVLTQDPKECELKFLRLILAKLAEIESQLKSPLTARQLHFRYCCICGERVTNKNVAGYEGKSALTGRLFCELCADEMEAP